jgi:hypothetical protein
MTFDVDFKLHVSLSFHFEITLFGLWGQHLVEIPFKTCHRIYACAQKNIYKAMKGNILVKSHTNEITVVCASADKGKLKIHDDRIHPGEKPYKCGQCSYACAEKGH